jgi:hypothetical protein
MAEQICAISLKEAVLTDAYKDIEISARPPAGTGIPLTTQANARAILNTFGDVKGQIAFFMNMTTPAAITAGVFNHPAFAAATMASSLNSKKALLGTNCSLSVTRAACYRLSTLFSTTATATIAPNGTSDGNLF